MPRAGFEPGNPPTARQSGLTLPSYVRPERREREERIE
uniref:Uncharacterized protein n=1 Tax=Anguilla anguilla TaxID=7936 RepID=A0A0E9QUX9_ANGAN